MSLLVVLLVSLSFFSDFAVAAIVSPVCTNATSAWTYNTLNQNPCTIAAYLMSTCNGGSFTIDALPLDYSYGGPSGSDDSDLCKCNTVAYSLISACDLCQGEQWISWKLYTTNCTRVLPFATFPNPIPAGTRVPLWAINDVTIEGTWDETEAYYVGGTPEILPGILLAPKT